jgi:hypothetical protein
MECGSSAAAFLFWDYVAQPLLAVLFRRKGVRSHKLSPGSYLRYDGSVSLLLDLSNEELVVAYVHLFSEKKASASEKRQ